MIASVKRLLFILFFVLPLLTLSSCSDQQSESGADDFTLQSVNGPVSLSDFRNHIVLLFFGYTHCPDVCPVTMNHVAQALAQLGESEAKRVQVLFITVDPKRDTAEHLAEYLRFFNPGIIGLTGSDAAIKQAATMFKVEYFSEGEQTGAYEMVHTSHLFLLDGEGKLADLMSHHTKPADIALAIRRWLGNLPAPGAEDF